MAQGPWPVGTLLAYRVISHDSDFVRNSPLWNKYVLLRVVKVEPYFGGKSKSMAVCLYDWVGESLPNPQIANSLSFTHISMDKPLLEGSGLSYLTGNLKEKSLPESKIDELVSNISESRKCTFVLLDWRCCKGINRDAVFTALECEPTFEDCTPAIYNEHSSGIILVHSIPFDAMLTRRFCMDEEKTASFK